MNIIYADFIMMHHAVIHPHEALLDFIPLAQRNSVIQADFDGNPAIKDTLESIRIPHPEIGRIEINGISVAFEHQISDGDNVEVFPVDWHHPSSDFLNLQQTLPKELTFILDVHLGKLAKELRMLGFDTFYDNSYRNSQLIQWAIRDQRIILTRDIGILKHSSIRYGHWMRNTQPELQTIEILDTFNLRDNIKPFSICLSCNGRLLHVDKKDILDRIPPKVQLLQTEFHRCNKCGKIYWKGTHYEHMLTRIRDTYGFDTE